MNTARVINESPLVVSVWDTASGDLVIPEVLPYSWSVRSSYLPRHGSNFTVSSGASKLQVPYTATDASVVVISPDGLDLDVAVLPDTALQPLASTWSNIDVCSLRVINTAPGPATVTGVTEACSPDCMLPELETIPTLSGSNVMNFDCARGFRLSAWTASPYLEAPEEMLRALEHSRYTVVITPPRSSSSGRIGLLLLNDAAGDSASMMPLLWAFLALFALVVTRWAVGYAIHRFGALCWIQDVNPPIATAQTVNCMVSLRDVAMRTGRKLARWAFRFLGYDHHIDTALRAHAGVSEVTLAAGDEHGQPLLDESMEAVQVASVNTVSAAPLSVDLVLGTKPGTKGRFHSVDALRGLSLCIMIFVNSGGV